MRVWWGMRAQLRCCILSAALALLLVNVALLTFCAHVYQTDLRHWYFQPDVASYDFAADPAAAAARLLDYDDIGATLPISFSAAERERVSAAVRASITCAAAESARLDAPAPFLDDHRCFADRFYPSHVTSAVRRPFRLPGMDARPVVKAGAQLTSGGGSNDGDDKNDVDDDDEEDDDSAAARRRMRSAWARRDDVVRNVDRIRFDFQRRRHERASPPPPPSSAAAELNAFVGEHLHAAAMYTPDCMRFPRIIHQVWRDKVPEAGTSAAALSGTWSARNPDWVHLIWTDDDVEHFLAAHYEWFLPQFHAYPYRIQRFDAVRYFLLHHFGGVYADMDFECVLPLDDWLHLANADFAHNSNSLMASVPRSTFALTLMQQLTHAERTYRKETKHRYVLKSTGPHFVSKYAKGVRQRRVRGKLQYTNAELPAHAGACKLPYRLFQPCSYCNSDEAVAACECADCPAIHRYTKSWNSYSSIYSNARECDKQWFAETYAQAETAGVVLIVADVVFIAALGVYSLRKLYAFYKIDVARKQRL